MLKRNNPSAFRYDPISLFNTQRYRFFIIPQVFGDHTENLRGKLCINISKPKQKERHVSDASE